MATKSQLKQYFETGKIPTQAQFGELIDFVQPLISDNVSDRPNQTLRFGGDGTEPIVNGLRIVHYYENDDTIYNYWIFTNEAGGNNQSGISIPMFVIKRISSKEPNLSLNMPNLEYAIPTREQLTNWIQRGYDCDTTNAEALHSSFLIDFTFKPWSEGGGSEGGGSEFPRVAYINSQSAWNTWLTKFKAAHPEADNGAGSNLSILNRWVIDNYTFIIEGSEDISFVTDTNTYEFFNCTIKYHNALEKLIILDFSDCVFNNCHLDYSDRIIGGNLNPSNHINTGDLEYSGRINGGDFKSCLLSINGNINSASMFDCNLHGIGNANYCEIEKSNVKGIMINSGMVDYSDIQQCAIDYTKIKSCRLHSCIIYSARLTTHFIEMIGCNIPFGNTSRDSFANSSNEIKGFIFGCDFSNLESIPGVMKGVQCCKFKSDLLSSGVIKADLFGNKSAESNGMNTGV